MKRKTNYTKNIKSIKTLIVRLRKTKNIKNTTDITNTKNIMKTRNITKMFELWKLRIAVTA